jgi:hypothetical protein
VGPICFDFSNLTKTGSNLEFEKECLTYSKNSRILHAARLLHYELFSKLCQHLILNKFRVKIPGTDSPFEI